MIIIYGGHMKKRSSRTYTLEEVSRHTTRDDLWMVIRGKVYDVTSLVDKHPGGSEVLFGCAGVDATSAFDDVSHSDYAFSMLTPCYLGDVDESDLIRIVPTLPAVTETDAQRRAKTLKKERIQFWEKVSMEALVVLSVLALGSYIYIQRRKWLDWTS